MKNLKVRIIGETPLLQHNPQTANPLNEFARALKKVSGKRAKVDADYAEMSNLEWHAGLYHINGQIIIPGEALEAMIRNAARKVKKGPTIESGLICEDAKLEYDGPKNIEKLWKGGKHISIMSVVVNGGRVTRTRPKFDPWAANVNMKYDENLLNEADIMGYFLTAGQ